MPRAYLIGIYTKLFAGGAAEINRRRRRKQSEKTTQPRQERRTELNPSPAGAGRLGEHSSGGSTAGQSRPSLRDENSSPNLRRYQWGKPVAPSNSLRA
jgi:hypothetical protein